MIKYTVRGVEAIRIGVHRLGGNIEVNYCVRLDRPISESLCLATPTQFNRFRPRGILEDRERVQRAWELVGVVLGMSTTAPSIIAAVSYDSEAVDGRGVFVPRTTQGDVSAVSEICRGYMDDEGDRMIYRVERTGSQADP